MGPFDSGQNAGDFRRKDDIDITDCSMLSLPPQKKKIVKKKKRLAKKLIQNNTLNTLGVTLGLAWARCVHVASNKCFPHKQLQLV